MTQTLLAACCSRLTPARSAPAARRALLTLAPALLCAAAAAQGGLPPVPPTPPGNPITAAKADLGRALFWDEQLSSNQAVACGTCHVPTAGGSDPRTAGPGPDARHPGLDGQFGTPDDVLGSPGLTRRRADGSFDLAPAFRLRRQVTSRKAPSMINAAFAPQLFWDGSAGGALLDPMTGAVVLPFGAALESQTLEPPVSDVEMAHVGRDWADVAQRVAGSEPLRLAQDVPAPLEAWIAGRSYPELFAEAFGTAEVTPARIAMAIATYERTLISNQAPFDAFLSGVPSALSPLEAQGFNVFTGPGLCVTCHAGPLVSNNQFEYIGVRPQGEDLGRFGVTGNPGDRGRMKVPSLRNVELRAPYFHNGSMPTLEAVIDFYNRGGDFGAPNKHPNIRPLGLNPQQRQALAAFLRRPLTDPRVASGAPPFDRPTLYSESQRVPLPFGAPTPGSAGFVPVAIADEPPLLGNPTWTVGIDRGFGGRPAALIVSSVALPPPGQPFQGATLHVGLAGAQVVRAPFLAGSGPGEGWGSVTLSLSGDPALAGVPFFAQWFVLDPDGLGRRLSATVALQATRF